LTWNVTGATSLTIDQGVGTLSGGQGSVTVSPTATTVYTITATNAVGATTAKTTVTVVPVTSQESLFSTQVPALVGNDNSYELGTCLASTVSGSITAVRFWKVAGETGVHTGKIWDDSGDLLASVTFTGESASGWQQQTLGTPLAIQANTPYVVSVNTGGKLYADTNYGLQTQIVNGTLYSIVGDNGLFGAPGSFPTNSYQDSNYFRDVVFVPGNGLNLVGQDIGVVGKAGSTAVGSGVFTLNGAGQSMGEVGNSTAPGTATDSFQYACQSLTGDGTIIARLTGQSGGDNTGVMIRQDLTPGSLFVQLTRLPVDAAALDYRDTVGAIAKVAAQAVPVDRPLWFKLSRAKNIFTGSYSKDGVAWTQISTVTVTMSSTVTIGLVECSQDNKLLKTGVFDNVSVTSP
jgi:hypothetical protein